MKLPAKKNSVDRALGVRERKRLETRQRITEAGIRLFSANGYEETTIDAVAAEAGISRRTFFHYFKSKDDILLSLQAGLGESLIGALEKQPADKPPMEAMRAAMIGLAAAYSAHDLQRIDRLMLSSEAVQARKQASYITEEKKLFTAMRERWPREKATTLRLIAMMSIGITRISLDSWRDEGGTRPLVDVAEAVFENLAGVVAVLYR